MQPEAPAPDRDALRRRHERRLQLQAPARLEELAGLPLFSAVPERARQRLLEKVLPRLRTARFPAGEEILREGEYSDTAFYVMEGEVEVVLGAYSVAEARPVVVRHGDASAAVDAGGRTWVGRGAPPVEAPSRKALGPGEVFGELAALSRYPVSASVRARSATRVLLLKLPALRMLLAAAPSFRAFVDARYRERALGRHLRGVPLFAGLPDERVAALAARAELCSFEPGQRIAAEGDPARELLLVRGGLVQVGVAAPDGPRVVTYLRAGDVAGEAGLLLATPWPFELHALDHVELVRLARADVLDAIALDPQVEQALWDAGVARLEQRGEALSDPGLAQAMDALREAGLVHGESALLIDLATCTRCDACVTACADSHDGVPRFVRQGKRLGRWLVPTACHQCTDPVCMLDCPTGAITRDWGALEVTIAAASCIGCGNCAQGCPWGNVLMVEAGARSDGSAQERAVKCDLCAGRREGPACVQACPHESSIRLSARDRAGAARAFGSRF
ncbi:MAG: cyclic nucleotide-binding domain-containing protein [Vicinamibacteria bacterium]|nr:cyclic nucleotide-binding domain-containing protein [Vicinamibacteria bacterium]